MTGVGPLEEHAVLVEADRIVAVAPATALAAPADARVVDGAGGFLIPGLGDMHVHLVRPADAAAEADDLALYAAHGVTTVRSMWGSPWQLELRRRLAAEGGFAPRLVLAGPGFGSAETLPAEAEARVRAQAAAGWDLVKVHWNVRADTYARILAVAGELDFEVSGHVPYPVPLDDALASRQRTIEHIDGFLRDLDGAGRRLEPAALRRAADRAKRAEVAVVPTMVAWEVYHHAVALDTLTARPELAYVPAERVARWVERYRRPPLEHLEAWAKALLRHENPRIIVENRRRLLAALDAAGVEVLFGTDASQPFTVPGFAVVREMRAMRAAGLSNRRILESATVAVGRYLGEPATVGVVAAGARADLVLLDADPLVDLDALATPRGVVVRGTWYDRARLDTILRGVRQRHADGAAGP
jgi:hypothetical protein